MYGGRNPNQISAIEKGYRKEAYLLTNSVLVLNLLKEKTPEAISRIAKFKEFLAKNNLAICSCGLMKEIKECHDNCVIVVNKDFKQGPFLNFLKKKSIRLGRKFEDKEILQHLQYVNRSLKWDEATLQNHLKATMSKWSTFNITDAAANKVNLVIDSMTQDYSGEDEYEDVSYGETDSSHY
jgi:hypothetical protein